MDYNARYYDPGLGRWLSPDTIIPDPTNAQSLNRYSYVYNRPLVYIDDGGNFPFIPFLVVLGGVALLSTASNPLPPDQQPPDWVGLLGLSMLFGGGAWAAAPELAGAGATAACADFDCTNEVKTGADLAQRFADKFAGKPGTDAVLQELEIGGRRAEGANWQIRYALENLDPNNVVGFEQAGTTGRVDIVLREGARVTFLEAKQINWYALEQKGITGEKAESIVRQMLKHAEGQDVFSKVVIEATGILPDWFVNVLEQEGITVEVFAK
jgi:hypothetical protein